MVRRQRAPAGPQQRHRVAHVVVRLAQEGDVAGERHLAAQAALDDGRAQQMAAGVGGAFLQFEIKAHGSSSGCG